MFFLCYFIEWLIYCCFLSFKTCSTSYSDNLIFVAATTAVLSRQRRWFRRRSMRSWVWPMPSKVGCVSSWEQPTAWFVTSITTLDVFGTRLMRLIGAGRHSTTASKTTSLLWVIQSTSSRAGKRLAYPLKSSLIVQSLVLSRYQCLTLVFVLVIYSRRSACRFWLFQKPRRPHFESCRYVHILPGNLGDVKMCCIQGLTLITDAACHNLTAFYSLRYIWRAPAPTTLRVVLFNKKLTRHYVKLLYLNQILFIWRTDG